MLLYNSAELSLVVSLMASFDRGQRSRGTGPTLEMASFMLGQAGNSGFQAREAHDLSMLMIHITLGG